MAAPIEAAAGPSSRLSAHARLAAVKRWRPDDEPALEVAERELREATLADHIRRVVETAPPLTAEQRARLAVLLMPSQAAGDEGGTAA